MGEKGVYTYKVGMPAIELMGVCTPKSLEQDYAMELKIVFALPCLALHPLVAPEQPAFALQ